MFGAETAHPTPPGAVVTRAPGLKIATQERREGGPGGRNAGTRAPEESEHAPAPRQRSRAPNARYNWREWGRRFTAQALKQPTRNGARNAPAPPASGNLLSLRERGTLVSPAEQTKRFCEGAAWNCCGGRRVSWHRSRSQAQPRRNRPTRHQGTPEKSARPGSDYITTCGACILFLIHWQHREFLKNAHKPLYYKGFRPF